MTERGAITPPAPADTEQAIDRTRVELALSLDALEQKLAARHLVEKGPAMFKDAFVGNDGLRRSLDLIRANAVPVALIGIGAAWLLASNSDVIGRIARDERVRAARRPVADLAGDIGTRAGEVASDIAARVGLGGDGGGSTDRPLGHTGIPLVDETGRSRPEGWMHQVADMAEGALRSARDSGSAMLNRAGGYAGERARGTADRLADAFRRHPLVIGAIGVMAGALLAALLPLSRVESDMLGGTPDESRAKEAEAERQTVPQASDVEARSAAATDKPSQG